MIGYMAFMSIPSARRMLFIGSETYLLGVVFIYFWGGGAAKFVEPVLPGFPLAFFVLLGASIWSLDEDREMAYFGFVSLILPVAWVFLCPSIVE